MDINPNLEYELISLDWIKTKCQNENYARQLYAALCNNRFFKDDKQWTCSWRCAGGIVADIRGKNEDYLDFYCSGNEGTVTPEIENDLLNLGWIVKPYEPKLKPGIYQNNWN